MSSQPQLERLPRVAGRRSLVASWLLLALLPAACDRPEVEVAPPATRLPALVERLALEAIRSGPLAGLSVGVARRGEIELARGYGLADVENGVPADAGTVYRIGSVTKQFTAAAIMQLVEQGRVGLDADLTRFLPDYPAGNRRVTIHHLLTHTSGIKSYTGLGDKWRRHIRLDLAHEDLVELFASEPFDFEPGERFLYNNSGYYLLGLVIERVSGLAYAEYLRRHVYPRAGLHATMYCDERPVIPRRAEGYAREEGRLVNDDPISMRHPFSAGALCSTTLDLLAWQQALEGGRVVSPDSYARMTMPATLVDGSRTAYGYGLALGELEGHRRIAHGGGINGFQSVLSRYPDDDLTIVVLSNTEGSNPATLERQIARAALGLPEEDGAAIPQEAPR